MINEILTCNECRKQSEDICGDAGWIRIEASDGLSRFSVSAGRPNKPKDMTHRTRVYKKIDKKMDFCCEECMLKWMGLEQGRNTNLIQTSKPNKKYQEPMRDNSWLEKT